MELHVKKFDELTTTELYALLKARAQIFIMEQNIHYQDLDDLDARSTHFLLTENGDLVAYMRAFYLDKARTIVKIGRVLTLTHGNGTGRELLEKSIAAIREQMGGKMICVDAQKHACGFYAKFGFQPVSGDFLEEGVVHVKMERRIAQ